MTLKRKIGLGKGLDALFLDNHTNSDKINSVLLNINKVEPNRDQPRKDFDESELEYLADSIKEYGIIQPIVVREISDGLYQIIAGERRWRASRMAGLSDIPCIIKNISDSEVLEIALIENLQRENLNAVEEALGYRELIDRFDMTQDQVAQKIGKSRSSIANSLRLLNLPEEVLYLLKDGSITSGHARALLSLENQNKMIDVCDTILKKELNVRDVEKLVKSINNSSSESIKSKENYSMKDSFYKEVEISLEEHLGRKIKINTLKDKIVLEIEFYDKKELIDIVNKLASN